MRIPIVDDRRGVKAVEIRNDQEDNNGTGNDNGNWNAEPA